MKASKGFRRGTRRRLKRKTREKFKVGDFLRKFKPDERVAVNINPSSHKGMPHPRFEGKLGRIKEKRGDSYMVEISIGNAKKNIIARPEHLKHVK
ncbi:MAG: 50S ribosomal protein L21e [Candidatus Aenigmarchaeota archaeon]|nr:50S ribosomal protein L21e [Candidatus Aenigmarchaeota archaeon]